jgi:hypothetical protein
MIDRLYDNGMLESGDARHCSRWIYPTMPRLNGDAALLGAVRDDAPVSHGHIEISRKRGYANILRKAFRVF